MGVPFYKYSVIYPIQAPTLWGWPLRWARQGQSRGCEEWCPGSFPDKEPARSSDRRGAWFNHKTEGVHVNMPTDHGRCDIGQLQDAGLVQKIWPREMDDADFLARLWSKISNRHPMTCSSFLSQLIGCLAQHMSEHLKEPSNSLPLAMHVGPGMCKLQA